MKTKALLAAVFVVSATFSSAAVAVEKGDMMLRFGWANVSPKSNNHAIVSVDSANSLAINFSYMLTSNVAVEVLAAYPFEHDIRLKGGGGVVGSAEHLPPTVSVQWHFMPQEMFKPYVGLGLNYTAFFSEKTSGALDGARLGLDSSFGLAAEVGADFMISENWFLNVSARYIDIESKARLNGDGIGDVNIDPYVYSVTAGFTF